MFSCDPVAHRRCKKTSPHLRTYQSWVGCSHPIINKEKTVGNSLRSVYYVYIILYRLIYWYYQTPKRLSEIVFHHSEVVQFTIHSWDFPKWLEGYPNSHNTHVTSPRTRDNPPFYPWMIADPHPRHFGNRMPFGTQWRFPKMGIPQVTMVFSTTMVQGLGWFGGSTQIVTTKHYSLAGCFRSLVWNLSGWCGLCMAMGAKMAMVTVTYLQHSGHLTKPWNIRHLGT